MWSQYLTIAKQKDTKGTITKRKCGCNVSLLFIISSESDMTLQKRHTMVVAT